MSQLVVRRGSVEEEYNELRRVLKRMSWYRTQGYSVGLPEEPKWRALAEESAMLDSEDLDTPQARAVFQKIDSEEMRLLFEQREYKEAYFEPGLQEIENNRRLIEQAIAKFPELQKKWETFKILPKYEVVLTKYGPGGNYDTAGKITMMTLADGTFRRDKPYMTPVHEMVHIGIEENVVDTYGLTHWEKERLVDKICETQFPEELREYKSQNIIGRHDAEALEMFLSQEGAMDNLPETIETYVKEHPRDKFQKMVAKATDKTAQRGKG